MSLSRTVHGIWLVLCLGSILLSCSFTKNASDPTSGDEMESSASRIMFLNYEIVRDTLNSTLHARLINKAIAEGVVKSDLTQAKERESGDLELQVLDRNHQLINSIQISNPLDKVVEFVNDKGELQKKTISLDSTQFSTRFQLKPGSATTLLKLITGSDSESNILVKTPIL